MLGKAKSKEVSVAKSFTMEDISDVTGHKVAIVLYDKDDPTKSGKAVITIWTEEEIADLMDRISDEYLDKWYREDGPEA